MRRLLAVALIVLLAPWLLAATAPTDTRNNLDGFDAFVSQAMKEWKVPGLAIAIVQDGKVILSNGYGFRDLARQLPVTPETLFAIGSITKSFTVTALGILVDQAKLDWDKPVREYLPSFRLQDPVASERMTPRDLVTHRSGLPRHDLLWYGAPFSRKAMFDRLRYLEPSKDFRSTFQYQNLMYMTAGYLAGEVAGMKWEELVRQRILSPLGMEKSNFSVRDSQKGSDFALPYEEAKDEIKEVPFRVIDEIGPAGSINSNVQEMNRYLLMHLNNGKNGEAQILSENNCRQMRTPQMVTAQTPTFSELGHSSYGLGLVVSSYRGHEVVSHGGGIDGFTALLSFLPQDKIGMILLSNRGGSVLPSLVSYNVYDRLLGLKPIAWSERFQEREKKLKESEAEAKKRGYTARREGTRPSHELRDYAGEYEHPGYGTARVELKQNQLKLTIHNISSPLRHFHYDIFEVPENPLDPLEGLKVSFFTNVKGDIGSLSAPLETNVRDIVFTRSAEKIERSVLESLVGEFILGAQTITVGLKGEDTLTLTVPGQPQYELVPTRGLVFDLKGLNGFSVEFKRDPSGAVTEAVFYQPNGTFVAKRK